MYTENISMEKFKVSCSDLLNTRKKLCVLDKENDSAVFKIINYLIG